MEALSLMAQLQNINRNSLYLCRKTVGLHSCPKKQLRKEQLEVNMEMTAQLEEAQPAGTKFAHQIVERHNIRKEKLDTSSQGGQKVARPSRSVAFS